MVLLDWVVSLKTETFVFADQPTVHSGGIALGLPRLVLYPQQCVLVAVTSTKTPSLGKRSTQITFQVPHLKLTFSTFIQQTMVKIELAYY